MSAPGGPVSANTGFVSPTRLQALRQQERQNSYRSGDMSPPPQQQQQQHQHQHQHQQQQPQTSPPASHQRTSSFFSFRGRSNSNEPKRQTSVLEKTRSRDSVTQNGNPNPPPEPFGNPGQPLHPEIKSIVSLATIHAHKIYFSGPLVRKNELGADGQKPVKDEEWTEVWAQLGGTTLSVWNMKEVKLASEQGREVPPSYINITDSFISVIGTITTHPTASQPSKRYPDVFTVNTAGANMILFSCPSPAALMTWAAALRLSAWEKSRLEEIYTAHLLRISFGQPNSPSPLIRGRLEGWARIRVAGHTDWKKVYVVITAGSNAPPSAGPPALHHKSESSTSVNNGRPTSPTATRTKNKNRVSALFSRSSSPPSSPRLSAEASAPASNQAQIHFLSGPKPKDRKKPLLILSNLTQAFAVYPERPELISRSTLIKLEGLLGDQDPSLGGVQQGHGVGAGAGGQTLNGKEGWVLVMPELPEQQHGHAPPSGSQEMLKWIVSIHDAFTLYGRPRAWTWDPRDPTSLMFAYPVGPGKEQLFLPLTSTETMDPKPEATSVVRGSLTNLVLDRMRAGIQGPQNTRPPSPLGRQPPSGPPIPSTSHLPQQQQEDPSPSSSKFQLPPLTFDGPSNINEDEPIARRGGALTPITERSNSIMTATTRDFGGSTNRRESIFGLDEALRESPEVEEGSGKREEYFTPIHTPGPSGSSEPGPSDSHSTREGSAGGTAKNDSVPPSPRFSILSNPYSVTLSDAPVRPPSSIQEEKEEEEHGLGLGEGAMFYMQQERERGRQNGHGGAGSVGSGSPRSGSPYGTSIASSGRPPLNANATGSPRLGSPSPLGSPRLVTSPGRAGSPRRGPSSAATPPPGSPSLRSVQPGPQRTATPPATAALNVQKAGSGPSSPSYAGYQQQQSPPTSPPLHHAAPSASTGSMGWTQTASPQAQSPTSVYSTPNYPPPQNQNQNQNQPYQQQSTGGPGPGTLDRQTSYGFSSGGHSTSSGDITPSGGSSSPHPHDVGSTFGREVYNPAVSSHLQPQPGSHLRPNLGRKPSGARAQGSAPAAAASSSAAASASVSKFSSSATSSPPPAASSSTLSLSNAPQPPSYIPQNPQGYYQQYTYPQQPEYNQQESLHSRSGSESSRGISDELASLGMATHESEADIDKLPPRLAQQHSMQSLQQQQQGGYGGVAHDDLDALAALSYLQVNEPPPEPTSARTVTAGTFQGQQETVQTPQQEHHQDVPPPPPAPQSPPSPTYIAPPPAIQEPRQEAYRSSFAPNKRQKAQAQARADIADARMKPGRKGPKKKSAGAWGESSDEEDDEEEEEDSDEEDDGPADRKGMPAHSREGTATQQPSPQQHPSHLRPPRSLPQVPPGSGSDGGMSGYSPSTHGAPTSYYGEPGRQTYYGQDGPQIRSQSEMPLPGRERQSVWSQALDPGRTPGSVPEVNNNANKPDYFVQIDPAEAMTKAFTPHGLLSAGLQDKEDRSAKRQEELAREAGASLINVPHKPPPPQIGLLGAVAAHERERTREGGLGAALTAREREKRDAEDRQRKFEEQQRQQMEQFGGGQMGSMYGGYNPMMGNPMMMGMNPMMTGMGMNPMMTGMNPMMTGSMFPGMMGGFGNQQAMMAAQQAAAQAYQQAMMSYTASQAGGSPGEGPSPGSPQQGQLNPMMSGQFDPRMSMMGMPMMGMGMGPMNPMMTGGNMSTFDARFSPGSQGGSPNEQPLQPPNALGQNRTRSSSPSPLRQVANSEKGSRPASPKV